jgi:iron(III) transport system ATP-binding protein
MATVTVRDLVVRYDATTVLDRVSVSVASGELLMLLGPSGCGKTTLLRSIAGFVQPAAGSIRFNDEEMTGRPAHARGVGMVFQSFALWPHMTVAENVGFGLRERRVPAAEIATRVAEALESTRMGG